MVLIWAIAGSLLSDCGDPPTVAKSSVESEGRGIGMYNETVSEQVVGYRRTVSSDGG